MNNHFKVPRFLDRDVIVWGLVPCAFAAAVVTLFALPNYWRATSLKDDAQFLKAKTNETISAQNSLRRMEGIVSSLRDERDRRCRPLGDGTDRDRLVGAITRPTDGVVLREQSIRTGQVTPAPGMPSDYQVLRREVTVEMVGTFDAIFGVIDAAEGIDQVVTTRSIEISVVATPLEQAQTGTGLVRAHIVFEEWFKPLSTHGAEPAPAKPANEEAGTPPLAMNGGVR
ncbi:MAG: hypothetical protein JNK53_07295 [Phycisphaerae bacterium]|nr:hypothetical protein [Phycisphaerae bacterium]